MYKQTGSKNRRFDKTSGNKRYGNSSNRGSSSSSGSSSGGNYSNARPSRPYNSPNGRSANSSYNSRSKNRRPRRETLDHSMYISHVSETTTEVQYLPERNFYDYNFHPVLAQNIKNREYINPTKIQDQAMPEILKGKDILGIANTGSGKTGAFLIPMIDKALKDRNQKVLIICPTRELATQINNEFKKFTMNTNLRMVLVIGGASMGDQIRLINYGPQFIVATPGRLIDLENRGKINLGSFTNVVLDEVDQMLDMGFVDDIKMIIEKLSPQRQSLFFSATMSSKEEEIANTILNTPVKVESNKQSPLKSIHQDVVMVTSRENKMEVLHELLIKREFSKVLIFSATKMEADAISQKLQDRGFKADALHGDKTQRVRSKVITKFRQDKIDILVATDVAARGIDIPDISHVINYDEPATHNDYIHRIGRTGRIGKKGTALTFVLSKKSGTSRGFNRNNRSR